MTTIQPRRLNTNPRVVAQNSEIEDGDEAFKPLTAQQAHVWRAAQPVTSPWTLLSWQAVVVLLVAGATWWLVGLVQAQSFAYGGFAVVLPAMLMVVGLRGALMKRLSVHPAGSLIGFAVFEAVKLLLSVLLMLAAPQAVTNVSWLALLAGVVVALKVHWLVFALFTMRAKRVV